jgi:hypothetical protein
MSTSPRTTPRRIINRSGSRSDDPSSSGLDFGGNIGTASIEEGPPAYGKKIGGNVIVSRGMKDDGKVYLESNAPDSPGYRRTNPGGGVAPDKSAYSAMLDWATKRNRVQPGTEDDFPESGHSAYQPTTGPRSQIRDAGRVTTTESLKTIDEDIAKHLPEPARFSDQLGDAVRFGDRIDLIKLILWRTLIIMFYSAVLTTFNMYCVTVVFDIFYNIDVIDWTDTSPGITLQDTITLEDGLMKVDSGQNIPLQIYGSNADYAKVYLAGTTTTSTEMHFGYLSGSDFTARSYMKTEMEGTSCCMLRTR